MPRRRRLQFLLILAGLIASMYVMISLYLPSSRNLVFGVNRSSGKVRVVKQSISFLPPHEFYRLRFEKRQGSAQRDGVIVISSKDQVPVKMTYRIRFGVEPQIRDSRRLVREGWSAWLSARVTEAVQFVTQEVPIEDFASPQSQFSAQRGRLRATVAKHLADSGLAVTGFEISKMEIDRNALLAYKRNELRRKARGNLNRVAIFGIEGADWELLSELMTDGRMPNLKNMMQNGAAGTLQTIQPTIAPLLWSTLETGVSPDRHGVIDFSDQTTKGPVDSRSRQTPAVWDIASAFGRTAGMVNCWTAWPPTAENTFVFDTPAAAASNDVYPKELAPRVSAASVAVGTIGYQQISRFLNITPAEFESSITASNAADPVVVFRSLLAKTWTDHRVALDLYRQKTPLLFMMDYDGTDTVNHLFGPFHPPMRDGVSSEGYRRYWPAVANYYSEVDRLLGEWLTVLPADTTVFVLSAHGMRWGKERPTVPPNGNSALTTHRNPGIFIAFGNNVVRSTARHPISIYDIAPTVVTMLGLPVSSDMLGKLVPGLFKSMIPVEGVQIASYSDLIPEKALASSDVDANAYRARLLQIGHLVDPSRASIPMLAEDETERPAVIPPDRWGLYAYDNNQAIVLKQQGRIKESVELLHQAIELNPTRPVPYLNLAMFLADKGQYTGAEEAFNASVVRGLPSSEKYFVDFAAMYRQKNLTTRAIVVLMKGRSIFPQSFLIAQNLGSALAAMERYTEAVPELERALSLQPTSVSALNALGLVYTKKHDPGQNPDLSRALDFWNRSLSINPHQPPIQQAVASLRSRL
ncbi:MAG TPA: alkaline phosphatase family protein [Thermoanaerobaculia bacterium]|nr:alkaline phosphatase family protein [Thermoanaerobaculia bacterium]